MYQFVCNFMAENAPGRPLSEVIAVVAYGFFDQELVKKLGFVNSHVIQDQWHLLDSGLAKIFGKSGYEPLECYLMKMVKSDAEAEFHSTVDLAFQ